jgi:hypothetical protein
MVGISGFNYKLGVFQWQLTIGEEEVQVSRIYNELCRRY